MAIEIVDFNHISRWLAYKSIVITTFASCPRFPSQKLPRNMPTANTSTRSTRIPNRSMCGIRNELSHAKSLDPDNLNHHFAWRTSGFDKSPIFWGFISHQVQVFIGNDLPNTLVMFKIREYTGWWWKIWTSIGMIISKYFHNMEKQNVPVTTNQIYPWKSSFDWFSSRWINSTVAWTLRAPTAPWVGPSRRPRRSEGVPYDKRVAGRSELRTEFPKHLRVYDSWCTIFLWISFDGITYHGIHIISYLTYIYLNMIL